MRSTRTFYVALAIPRGAEPETVRPAYRKVVTRYRRQLEQGDEHLDEPTEPPLQFAVLRSYSERRHGALFDRPEPLPRSADQQTEIDRFFGGVVPEVGEPPRARRAGKDLFVELRLEREQARRGGLFPVHIPVLTPCPRCGEAATETDARLACPLCQGSGQVTTDRVVEVTAPPGVEHGRVARAAMEDIGLDETDLVIYVVVS